ncbi:MAG: hypothetical protein NTW21_03210 [Verrucomicrobia bacterium]|nr:hypothetical protein [Verrucomicrobiota bacterium]
MKINCIRHENPAGREISRDGFDPIQAWGRLAVIFFAGHLFYERQAAGIGDWFLDSISADIESHGPASPCLEFTHEHFSTRTWRGAGVAN